MRTQCALCGAPVRGRTECKYCGTLVPPPEPTVAGGPAICTCGILAARRCLICDAPVCDQHADAYWPGQQKPQFGAALEQATWDWATTQVPASGINACALESVTAQPEAVPHACTMCRATYADRMVTALSELPAGLTAVELAVEAARAGVGAPALVTGVPTDQWVVGLAAYLERVQYPIRMIATTWELKRSRQDLVMHRLAAEPCWTVPFTTGPRPIFLVVARDGRTAGWANVGSWHGRLRNGAWIEPDPAFCAAFAADPLCQPTITSEGSLANRKVITRHLTFAPGDDALFRRASAPNLNTRIRLLATMLHLPYANGVIRLPRTPAAAEF